MSVAEPPEKRANRAEGYRPLFMDVFPKLVGELTDDDIQNTEISVGIQHLKEVCYNHVYTVRVLYLMEHLSTSNETILQVLEYNVPGGMYVN